MDTPQYGFHRRYASPGAVATTGAVETTQMKDGGRKGRVFAAMPRGMVGKIRTAAAIRIAWTTLERGISV